MSVFRNSCRCPPQPKSYKDMKQKMEKLNQSHDWASSKIPDFLSICKEIAADRHAYEVCCKCRKTKIKTPEKKYLTLSQNKGLRKSKSSLGGSHARLGEIYRAPLAQKFFFAKRKPKWRVEHEQRLQEEAKVELEKNMAARLQDQVKKLEAQEKFQRVLEQNQRRTIRWGLENEKKLRKPEKDQEETGEQKKEKKPTPKQVEKDLIKIFTKLRRNGQDKRKIDTKPPDEVLNTPLGKYEKSHRSKDAERLHLPTKDVERKNAWDPQGFSQDDSLAFINKTVPFPNQLPKASAIRIPKIYLLREIPRLNFEIKKNKTTNVGAKFSWNFRQMMKTNAVLKPKMSKTFDKLVRGKNIEVPELLPALKSRGNILQERNLKAEGEFHKSRPKDESMPNYGVSKKKNSEHKPSGDIKPKYTEHFQKMLRGKEEEIPELNAALKSQYEIFPDIKRAEKSSSGRKPKIDKSQPFSNNKIKPKCSKLLYKMLKGKEKDFPELNAALKSQHEILPDIKRAGKSSSGLKMKSAPNYGLSKIRKPEHLAIGELKPKFSKQFHKMLRGKEKDIPELNKALMSHHEILPDIKRAGKSSSGLKMKSAPNYGLSKIRKPEHLDSDELKPKFSKQFHKMLRGKEKDIPELNAALKSQHEILPDIKRAGNSSSGLKMKSAPNYGLSKIRKPEHLAIGELKPKFSKQFHKMLRGKEKDIPELNKALMSHHEILPDLNSSRSKSSLGYWRPRPKMELEPNYKLSETDTSRLLPSGEIEPKISKKFYETLRNSLNESPIRQQGHQERPSLEADKQYENSSLRSILKGKTSLSTHPKLQVPDQKGYKPKNKTRKAPVLSSGRRRPLPIKNLIADQRRMRRFGTKGMNPYLNMPSPLSFTDDNPLPVRPSELSQTPENSGRPNGSLTSIFDMDQFFPAVSENEQPTERFSDGDETMFDTNLSPKATLSDLLNSFAMTGEAKKLKQSKHSLKSHESTSGTEHKIRRDSSFSPQPERDETKKDEIQAVKKKAWWEEYQKFILEEKAAVQARIKELMKYVAIREDFQPPKPPRDFIKENIEILQNMRPRKKAEKKKKRKPKYQNLMEKLRMPELKDYKSSGQQGSGTEQEKCMKKRCCQRQNQQEKPEAPAPETVASEAQKYDTCDVRTNGYSSPNFNYIEKRKALKIRKREKRKEAWSHEENKEEWCPKDC